jgi:hypothetical protein
VGVALRGGGGRQHHQDVDGRDRKVVYAQLSTGYPSIAGAPPE